MSDFYTELVPHVPPLSIARIESIADAARGALGLSSPRETNWLEIAERRLPAWDIDIYPASAQELFRRGVEALTEVGGEPEDRITIVLQEDRFYELEDNGPRGNRARGDLSHELGHAILHVPVLRERLRSVAPGEALARQARGRLRAFEDPEWQAWTFAGALLLPRASLTRMLHLSVHEIARAHCVSPALTRGRLRRARLQLCEEGAL